MIQVIAGMAEKRVLILGDMIADVYLTGKIARISREAPVLVLEYESERVVPGGAANVANNIATLGGTAIVAGLVGDDRAGEGLRAKLAENGADVSGLLKDASRPTIAKTRVVAGGRETVSQQIVRVDRESRAPLSDAIEAQLWAQIQMQLPTLDGLILSDYGSAVVCDALRTRVLAACRAHGVTTMADSRYAIDTFVGVDYVKQNDAEIAAAAGRPLETVEALVDAARALLAKLDARGVLVTRGAQGMLLVLSDGSVTEIPVVDKSEVFDVSGAGDTCVATVVLALAAGATPAEAATLSNHASGIAVRKLGTATVSAAELAAVVRRAESAKKEVKTPC